MLAEPAQVTNVVDAFDELGGLDLHFTLAYEHTWKRTSVWRETQSAAVVPGAAGGVGRVEIGQYAENTSRLHVQGELGVYRDVALVVRLPIILARRASLGSGSPPGAALEAAPGQPLFTLPFRSPNRSGVEYLGLGADWGVTNQWRDPALPTWRIGVETRLSVAEAMHACDLARCAYPSDIDRDGVGGELVTEVAPGRFEALEGEFPGAARKAGVSRGTTALELHTWLSRRIGYVEPYVGGSVQLEVPNEGSDFAERAGSPAPPLVAKASVGAELVPWEAAELFQRLSVDVRLSALYRSAGQDYSELFDALGSSAAPSFRAPAFARYRANPDPATAEVYPSVIDPDSDRVFPTGLTRVERHGAYALRVAGRWQAGQYVHFDVAGSFAAIQRHFVTGSHACDASRPSSLDTAGPCRAADGEGARLLGSPNPEHRPEVDQPGRRFSVGTGRSIDAWVGATVMF